MSNNNELFYHLGQGAFTDNRSRQEEFREVKSLTADFRKNNTELLSRIGKQNRSKECNLQRFDFSPSLVCHFSNHI